MNKDRTRKDQNEMHWNFIFFGFEGNELTNKILFKDLKPLADKAMEFDKYLDLKNYLILNNKSKNIIFLNHNVIHLEYVKKLIANKIADHEQRDLIKFIIVNPGSRQTCCIEGEDDEFTLFVETPIPKQTLLKNVKTFMGLPQRRSPRVFLTSQEISYDNIDPILVFLPSQKTFRVVDANLTHLRIEDKKMFKDIDRSKPIEGILILDEKLMPVEFAFLEKKKSNQKEAVIELKKFKNKEDAKFFKTHIMKAFTDERISEEMYY